MLKPWKKWTSRRRQQHQHRKSRSKSHGESETEDQVSRRALPPVPVSSGPNTNGEIEEDEDQMLADLALRMEEMEPGTAFMPDDEYDDENDEIQQSEEQAFDFSKSIEKVKSVR